MDYNRQWLLETPIDAEDGTPRSGNLPVVESQIGTAQAEGAMILYTIPLATAGHEGRAGRHSDRRVADNWIASAGARWQQPAEEFFGLGY